MVVSSDEAVQAKAAEFYIEVKTNIEFIASLEGETSQETRQAR